MSQRNWKTSQRKSRTLQPNFISRPIETTLSSIKEVGPTSTNSTTASNSLHSSTANSSSDSRNSQNKHRSENDYDKQSSDAHSSSSSNNIFQIIEEECYNGQLKKQGLGMDSHENDNDKSPPPIKVFNHDATIHVNGQVHNENKSHNDHESQDNNEENEDEDDDDDAPIIYAHHDDDSVSQITSSIAGNSMYSSDHMLSKLSSSYNKSYNNINNNQKYKQSSSSSGGGFHNHNNSKSNGWSTSVPVPILRNSNHSVGSNSKGSEGNKTPLMDDEELDKFFGTSNYGHEEKVDDLIDVNIYTTEEKKNYSSQVHNGDEDDFTLREMYSMGPSVSNNSRRTFLSSSTNNDGDIFSFLQQARLKTKSALIRAKHTVKRFFPQAFSESNQKKDDDHDLNSVVDDDFDYLGILMASSFGSSTQHDSPERQRRKEKVNLLWICCLLAFIWSLLYLAKVGNDSAWEKNRNKRPGNGIPMPLNGKLRGVESAYIETIVQAQNGNDSAQQNNLSGDGKDPVHNNALNDVPQNVLVVEQSVPEVQQPLVKNEVPIKVEVDKSHIGMQLPDYFNNFMDINIKSNHYVPFFWHVPRTAGATINEILGVCYHLRMAANAGIVQGHAQDTTLQLIDVGAGHTYVNVDVSTSEGIQRAASLGLASSGLADVVVSPLINESGQLFDVMNQARIFTMLRHPVERAASLFYFLQDVRWKNQASFNQELANISISDFFGNKMGESNWQVRYLTNQVTKPYIDANDLKLAKEILRRKCLVGLINEREESFRRFQKFFGWQLLSDADKGCVNSKLQWDWSFKHPHEPVERGSELWNKIAEHNQYDMALYQYAKELFKEQYVLVK